MNPGTLIIFSGLPGSGKSTLASQLAAHISATYLRIDTIEQGLRETCGLAQIKGEGYELAYRLARENLELGNDVVADSVNPWPLTRTAWSEVAEKIGAPFVNVEITCSNKEEHKRRVENRRAAAPALNWPTWQEVVDRDYRAWDSDRIVVDTAARSEKKCLEELISSLKSRLSGVSDGFFA